MVCHRISNIYPMLYSRTLLIIHPIHTVNSLHLEVVLFYSLKNFFWPCHVACEILFPNQGSKAHLEVQSRMHTLTWLK